ncbi:phage tail sheath subtilisin-like domain-containing protein, partial [Methylophaga nitratireducenticrescens]
ASGDTAAEIATAITAAITAATDQPVTATVNGGTPEQIDLTCRWKGETGNDLDLRLSYYDESQPESVSLSFTAMSGGTANPDIDDVFIAIGDQWFNWMVMPYTDTANLVALETELDSRWGPMRQIGCRAFSAYKGTHSETGTFGSNRNPVHVTSLGTNNAPEPPYLWASVNGIQGAKHLAIDPARQLRTIPLPGLKPPKLEDRWTDAERNLLLFDGISTYTVDHGGVVRIERQITMYQENELGFADDSYLDINTPETLERIRYEQRAMVAQKYPRHKLADDDYDVPVGQAIMQPKLAKVEFLALYKEFELKGWVQDYDGYKETFTAQINDDDPDRLDIYDSPKLINNLRVTAVHTEFRR